MSKVLFCADYSAIEARVLFWLADHKDGLTAYRDNRPLYEEMAARIHDIHVSEVTPIQRELGKRVVLGCGYQMGANTFMDTCRTFGNFIVSEELAEKAVEVYRKLHSPVPKLWKLVQSAAISAVKNPGKVYRVHKVLWCLQGDFLYCKLPSSRKLAFYKPEIRYERRTQKVWRLNAKGEKISYTKVPYGDPVPKLYHWSVNPITKQWGLGGTYGGKLVENMTQAVARDLMAEAMLRLEDAGFEVILSVHDELVGQGEPEFFSIEQFKEEMAKLPKWADGLPVKVTGWSGLRYKK